MGHPTHSSLAPISHKMKRQNLFQRVNTFWDNTLPEETRITWPGQPMIQEVPHSIALRRGSLTPVPAFRWLACARELLVRPHRNCGEKSSLRKGGGKNQETAQDKSLRNGITRMRSFPPRSNLPTPGPPRPIKLQPQPTVKMDPESHLF